MQARRRTEKGESLERILGRYTKKGLAGRTENRIAPGGTKYGDSPGRVGRAGDD